MLDGLKGIGGRSQRQADDLRELIASAKEEYGALSAMLTQLSARGSKLAQVDQKVAATTGRLGEIVSRIESLETRAAAIAEAEQRARGLSGLIEQTQ